MTTQTLGDIDETTEPVGRMRKPGMAGRHPFVLAAISLLVGLGALIGVGVGSASASLSPFVNQSYENFGGTASDCTAYAGAYYRADKQTQGDAEVPCNYRHTQTAVYVRLLRSYEGVEQYGPWTYYRYPNSYGTGRADLVTSTWDTCGAASWKTEVYAIVTSGNSSQWVDFTNQWQTYNPCG